MNSTYAAKYQATTKHSELIIIAAALHDTHKRRCLVRSEG